MSRSASLEKELNVAIDAVRAAARVCQTVQRQLVTADTLEKKDRSPVTVADFASQAVVCARLAASFADDLIVGEEAADELRQDGQAALRAAVVRHAAEELDATDRTETRVLALIDHGGANPAPGTAGRRHWTLDPIDGTKGFLRGEQYAVALALIEDGQVVLGVLGCPNLPIGKDHGVLLAARRGGGTTMHRLSDSGDTGVAVRVSDISATKHARFCESVESGHSSHDDAARIADALGIVERPIRMDSQAKYATVARGDAQIYLRMPTSAEYRENIWDHAAGMLAVTEAGGKVTDIHGQPLDFSQGRRLEMNQGVVATCGRIHEAVIAAVASVVKR